MDRLTDLARQYEVIPPDQRELVRRILDPPFRWICSLHAHFRKPWPKGMKAGLARGTGLLVGPRHVLTAAHCIYPDGQTSPTSLYVAPARNGRTDPFGRCKAVAFNVPSLVFGRYGIDQRHDYAIITLEREIAHQRYPALGGEILGHWGCTHAGHGTVLRALGRDFLQGKRVNVCGYPGDRCGIEPIDIGSSCYPALPPSPDCSSKDRATTQWIGNGILSWRTAHDPLFLHTADTSRGQSGSPMWVRSTSGRRCLAGVHVDAECRFQLINGKRTLLPVRGNLAVHINDQVLAMIRSWMS